MSVCCFILARDVGLWSLKEWKSVERKAPTVLFLIENGKRIQQENDGRMKHMMESHKLKASKVTEVEQGPELP